MKTCYIEDYKGNRYKVSPCPKCGKAPERNNCGPEAQGVSCYDCNIHAMVYEEIGSNAMLLNTGNISQQMRYTHNMWKKAIDKSLNMC